MKEIFEDFQQLIKIGGEFFERQKKYLLSDTSAHNWDIHTSTKLNNLLEKEDEFLRDLIEKHFNNEERDIEKYIKNLVNWFD